MHAPTSYQVLHWQLKELDNIERPEVDSYIVVWWEQIPLGHLWWDTKIGLPLKQLLRDAIQPAIHFHLNDTDIIKNRPHKTELTDINFKELPGLMMHAMMPKPDATLSISIVICTRNRPEHLQKCLSSLTENINDSVEIIVVDNDPADEGTENVVASFPAVRYILEKRKGLDIARNTGAHYATNEIVAYTDDDVLIPGNWVKNISSCFNNPLTMAVTGLVLPAILSTEAQVIFERDWGFNKGYLPKKFNHRYFLDHADEGAPVWDIGAGANMAFRREAFLYAGLFDERLDVGAAGCSGDSEMWFRILAKGWNCCYFPHLFVYHHHRNSMKALKEQLFHYMKGHVCALLVQHEKYPHTGNLKRLNKLMPKYYAKRLAKTVLKGGHKKNAFLFTEIKGCIAGKNYYNKNNDILQTSITCLPTSLSCHRNAGPACLISVVIPCYNQGNYLAEAIKSALNQTHEHIEIIVVDDGSDDNTKEVCDLFKEIKYIRAERVGLPAARNIGVEQATGDYVIFLDADDFLYRESMEVNLYFFNYYKDVVMVSGGHQRVDQNGDNLPTSPKSVKAGNNYTSLLQGNYIAMEGAVMYRRDLFPYFNFDTSLKACEDYDLNLRIARDFPIFGHDKIIAAYRIHDKNMSANNSKMIKNALKALGKQSNHLFTQEQRNAYAQGIVNWNKFYQS